MDEIVEADEIDDEDDDINIEHHDNDGDEEINPESEEDEDSEGEETNEKEDLIHKDEKEISENIEDLTINNAKSSPVKGIIDEESDDEVYSNEDN